MRVLVVLASLSTYLAGYFSDKTRRLIKAPWYMLIRNVRYVTTHGTGKLIPDSMRFKHQTTGFNLRGKHGNASCRSCHTSLVFSHIGVSCVDCHEDVHKSELGFQCQNCHTPDSWNNMQEIFESHSETRFPLVGVHAIVDCESCHSDEYSLRVQNDAINL